MNYARFKVKTEGGYKAICNTETNDEIRSLIQLEHRIIIGNVLCKIDNVDFQNNTFSVVSLEGEIPKFEGYAICIDSKDISDMPTLEEISDYISKYIGMIQIVDTSNKDHDIFTLSNYKVGLGYRFFVSANEKVDFGTLKMVWLKIYPTEIRSISTLKEKD